ncbi:MAG: transposase, partial [Oscillospiraceae bacterium]
MSKINEKIMPEIIAWQNRPSEQIYLFVFMGAIHYKLKENRQDITKAAYVVLGIRMDGREDYFIHLFRTSAHHAHDECYWSEPSILQGHQEQTVL